jgi:hypothetical protein
MRVHELIDILSDQPADAEVELAVIAPVEDGSEDITVDRYFIDGVLPWEDDDDDTDGDDDEGELTIWLVGGEEADVNAFLDAIEQPDV